YRTYRAGYVFRNEKPGPGRFRQFMQFDADTVGAAGVQADAEMCMMMADTMEALGIKRGEYVVRVNNRKVLDALLEYFKILDPSQKLKVLRSVDKYDKFGWDGVYQLLTVGRWDGGKPNEGDFTSGAGLSDHQAERILSNLFASPKEDVVDGKLVPSNERVLQYLATNARGGVPLLSSGYEELYLMNSIFAASGYGSDRIKIDMSVVRGLEYYTGPVFEAELTFDVTNEKGEKVVFGSVGGGGRYDGLVSRFMGQPVPATGFSIGVSRLMTALKNLGKLGQDEILAPVIVCVMDRDAEALGKYQQFVQTLRHAGIRAEMYQGNPKNFGNQLKYADRRGSPLAIIQGSEERARKEVQIKDLIEGKRLSGEITDNVTWREARVAQVTVPEADLVAKVKEMLAAQEEDRARNA
ncbi:MAG: hypothetical protein RIR97_2113, partial [Pseudomonadota bacterium]